VRGVIDQKSAKIYIYKFNKVNFMLQIFNTLTKRKETFEPLQKGKIGIYVCGITVYDYCHIGHARMFASFDVMIRYLRASGYEVKYVRNITDIDDKIINRSQQNDVSYTALTEQFTKAFHEDLDALNILRADEEPRATNYISEMIAIIQKLIDNGIAYIGSNGDVYYAVNKFQNYCELAHQDVEKLRSGARVAITEAKEDPLDFVLWKLAKPGEPHWGSPWGEGRPGWHIECSAMSMKCLGEHFDIHGGGFDLIFPHHQNEIAQSEGSTGHKFVNTWMHVGFVTVNKEKMSKSLGNFFTIRDVLKQYSGEVIRYFLISSHYRSPLNYSTELLDSARSALERIYLAFRGLIETDEIIAPNKITQEFEARFNDAMDDDFNTPIALAVLFDMVREINRLRAENILEARSLAFTVKRLGNVLGILQQTPEEFLQDGINIQEPKEYEQQIADLIAARNQARADKNWKLADELRDQLTKLGIIIEDGVTGTTWRRA
jgi:cysteinyl-tRNA synthetase